MNSCEEFEGMIAQAVYEELPQSEQHALSAHLAACAHCEAESKAMVALRALIRVEPVAFEGNLRPVLEEQIRTQPSRSLIRRLVPRLVLSGLFGILVAVISIQVTLSLRADDDVNNNQLGASGPFDQVMTEVTGHIEREEYARAYVTLHESILRAEPDTVPSEAQQLLADLAYEQLGWYPEAFAAYDQLRLRYPSVYQQSPESIHRYAVLDEARLTDTEYASLHNWTRVIREDDVNAFGQYIESYPGTLHASEAVQEMARLISEDQQETDMSVDSVLEYALLSSENPVVVAQIKLELGRYHVETTKDAEKARALFEEVEDSSVSVLAQAASQSLRALGIE